MKFVVDEMPYFRHDCPFWVKRDNNGDDYCKCGNNVYGCEYFVRGRDPEFCNWLNEVKQ